MKVYSPSSTKEYSMCPRRWVLRKRGWRPRVIGNKEISAAFSLGFHAAAMVWYDWKQLDEALAHGQQELSKHIQEYTSGEYFLSNEDKLMTLPDKLDETFRKFVKHDPIPEDWQILHTEHTHEEQGKLRTDLEVIDSTQSYAPVDIKVKLELDMDKWLPRVLEDFHYDWQLYHGAWAMELHYYKPVTHYYILLVIAGRKFHAKVYPYPIATQYKRLMENDAARIWSGMETKEGLAAFYVPGSATHEDRYGDCPYKKACLEHGLDEQRMSVDYVKVEKK